MLQSGPIGIPVHLAGATPVDLRCGLIWGVEVARDDRCIRDKHRRHDLWALRRAQAGIESSGLDLVGSYLSLTEVSEYAGSLPEAAKRHRLYPILPPEGSRVIAFYPMSKRRGPAGNWYELDFEERSRLMHDHGSHGRRHAGKVVQLVTASTGVDDWEWAVTLFATDSAALKNVVYDLRFDEATARYAEFGPFTVGLLCDPLDLFAGTSPHPAP